MNEPLLDCIPFSLSTTSHVVLAAMAKTDYCVLLVGTSSASPLHSQVLSERKVFRTFSHVLGAPLVYIVYLYVTTPHYPRYPRIVLAPAVSKLFFPAGSRS